MLRWHESSVHQNSVEFRVSCAPSPAVVNLADWEIGVDRVSQQICTFVGQVKIGTTETVSDLL